MARRLRQIARVQSEQVALSGPRSCWRRSTVPWRIGIRSADGTITHWIFPAGEEWNQATIWRPLRIVIDEQELGDEATFVHDMLFRYRGALPRAWLDRSVPGAIYRTYTRDEADAALYAIGVLTGAPHWRAALGHRAVRVWWWLAEALRVSPKW